VKAALDVEIPGWGFIIYGLTECRKGDQKWINMPQRKDDSSGETKWWSHCRFASRERHDAFSAKVFEAIEEYHKLNAAVAKVESSQEELPF